MTNPGPARHGRSRALQAAHLVFAALAAILIAVASQGWPAPGVACETGSACDGS